MHITIIDDEENIQKTLSYILEKEGYTVSIYSSGTEALKQITNHKPDLIILDIIMPGIDGIKFCEVFRSFDTTTPIIFLSSRIDEISKLDALERGGDDYLTKPYSVKELLVRINVCLRRVNILCKRDQIENSSRNGFYIDSAAYQVFYNNQLINFSVTEFRIFFTLSNSPGVVFSRDDLMKKAYPEDNFISDRNIDTHITRIRKKINKVYGDFRGIESVYGLGYRYKKEY